MSVEERAIKTHSGGSGNNFMSSGARTQGRTSPVKMRGHSEHNESAMLDYSQVIERTEKMKRRWLRVIENKEKMVEETQRELKHKYDKVLKFEKLKKKRAQDSKDDLEVMVEKRKEKMLIIQKRKEHMQQEYEKHLKQKEAEYKKRMDAMLEHKRRLSQGEHFETSLSPKA